MVVRAGLTAAAGALAAGERVVLRGPAGVGKSTLLDCLVRDRPGPVIRVGTGSDALEFAVVAEIIDVVPARLIGTLAGPQREAVGALLRREPGEADPLAVRFALAEVLAGSGGLLVIDDAHWTDPASVGALTHALRRCGGRVGCLIAERTSPGLSVTERLGGAWTVVPVPPLSGQEVASLLSEHGIACHLAGRVHAASGGFAGWALEIGRALAAGTDPRPVRRLIAARLVELPAATRDVLLPVALARRPTFSLLCRAGWPDADVELQPAVAAGLVTLDEMRGTAARDATVRFAGTAIADTVIEEEGGSRRATVHRALAEASEDPADRLRHRALADPGPDAGLAHELAAAAVVARAAGDRAGAAELGLLAAERAPGRASGVVAEATADAAAAGRADLVQRGEALLEEMGTPAERTRARLAVIRTAGQSLHGHDDTFARALADAGGNPALQAEVRIRLAVRANLTEANPARARDEADRACDLATAAGDRALLAAALTMRARVERIIGHPDAERSLADALILAPGGQAPMNDSARFLAARHALFDDRLDDARTMLLDLLPAAERSGDAEDLTDVLRGLAEAEVRSGACVQASSYAARAMELTKTAGLSAGPAWYSMALTEAAGGDFGRARAYAEHGAAASEEEHDVIFLARCLHVLGVVDLVRGDPAEAVRALGRVGDLERMAGVVDPSQLRWHGDLAIALALTGRPGQARRLLAEVRPTAEQLGRMGVVAALDHAQGEVMAADGGDLSEAAEALACSARRFGELGLPLEQGRVLLSLASVTRRRRRRAEARVLVARAGEVFSAARAWPWLRLTGQAAARLDPVALKAGHAAELTASEERVAELVAAGASNREIAVALSVSVKTVEARLTRIYRKRGVRSRTQLATLLR
ncbi:helix-turn-helix transcriptional regulator [Actinomadura sp. KC06]|uniref:helix-turn-helix transcriptional regulator n=1 Tax=Actinomadura sp. KC06 TaxID=2530369 RepID=UPI0010530C5D|nr:LuxR family transcriptional regulator [Actinomadura sp. KC06]TDD38150.1 helix-turn-helix transcriptional regulator [Actinomadura sp. KC06]